MYRLLVGSNEAALGPAILMPLSAQETVETTNPTTGKFRGRVLRHLQAIVGRTTKSLTDAQARYKKYFDQHVMETVKLWNEQDVLIERSSMATQWVAERLFEAPRTTLPSKAFGTFKVLDSTQDTVNIDEDGIRIKVSMDRISLARARDGVDSPERADSSQIRADHTSIDSHSEATITGDEPTIHQQEYVVDRIVGHQQYKKGTEYCLRWYGYTKRTTRSSQAITSLSNTSYAIGNRSPTVNDQSR